MAAATMAVVHRRGRDVPVRRVLEQVRTRRSGKPQPLGRKLLGYAR